MTPGYLDQLILDVLSGDMEALETVYNELEGCVYTLALSILRSPAAAQDVTQDTFVRLCTSGAKYKPCGLGKSWVLTITRNLALRAYKQNRRFADLENLPESVFSDHGKAEIDQLNRLLLSMALEHLREEDRQIVLLHASGLKHDEIASVVGRPAATVRWKYAQAIKKLAGLTDSNLTKEGTSHEN